MSNNPDRNSQVSSETEAMPPIPSEAVAPDFVPESPAEPAADLGALLRKAGRHS